MTGAAVEVAAHAVPDVKHSAWVLSKWGLGSSQLSTLLTVAGRLETHVPHPSIFSAPEPWHGTAEQEEALQQLVAELVDCSCGSLAESDLVWFLRESGFDVAAAKKKLGAMLAWRQAHRLTGVTKEEVQAEFLTGKAYAHAHTDVKGRPVLVVRSHRHIHGEFKLEDTKRLFAHIVDEAIAKLRPGQDQLVGVVDLAKFHLAHVDLGFAAFVIEAFQVMYPGRVAQMLLVDAPWVFRGPWEVMKPLLRKYAPLVRFVSRAQLAAEFFTPETLPPDFAK